MDLLCGSKDVVEKTDTVVKTDMSKKDEEKDAEQMKAAQGFIRIGDVAPDFTAKSTQGDISLHKYLDKSWGIIFSHPADFTPVCTTELGAMAKLDEEFTKRNVKVLAYSVDSRDDHTKWVKDIEQIMKCKINFPILDGSDRAVAIRYGMLDPSLKDVKGLPLTVRSLFIIDPNKIVKLILTYPASTGRNFNEVLRCVDSLQMAPKHSLATPADWTKGCDCVVLPSVSTDDAKKKFPKGVTEVRPWLRYTPDPETDAAMAAAQ